MKLNFIPTIIAIAISILIAYGLCNFHLGDDKAIISLGSFLFVATTLIMAIAATTEYPRTNTNIKTVSGVFFIVALVSNIIFTLIPLALPLYVVTNGVLLLVFILIVYLIYKAKQ